MLSVDTLADSRPASSTSFSADELRFFKCICHVAVPAFKEAMVMEDFTLAANAALQLLQRLKVVPLLLRARVFKVGVLYEENFCDFDLKLFEILRAENDRICSELTTVVYEEPIEVFFLFRVLSLYPSMSLLL